MGDRSTGPHFNSVGERRVEAPEGDRLLARGRGEVLLNGVAPANPKAEQVLPPDALVEVRLPGGGGYGRPEDRDPDLIAADQLGSYAR